MKPLNEITKAHKEYFAYISKLGKTIDKSFNKEAQNLCLNAEIPSDYLNSVFLAFILNIRPSPSITCGRESSISTRV